MPKSIHIIVIGIYCYIDMDTYNIYEYIYLRIYVYIRILMYIQKRFSRGF